MHRFAAFLRGVSPMNLKMTDLKQILDAAGFTEVKTILSSGNVAFNATIGDEEALERRIEEHLQRNIGRSFPVTIRSVEHLRKLLAADPFSNYLFPKGAKQVVTFLWHVPDAKLALPIRHEGVIIHEVQGLEVFTIYVPHPKGPIFMNLLEKTFGKEQTTRTWETVRKCAQA
ncbi:MAG: pyridoxamine 5'-phosphate oxidase [Bacteroidia bacterium]|nr:MAG: pyridoxamine 5'-phosphate oxidase [Bacteroidia bacterium]